MPTVARNVLIGFKHFKSDEAVTVPNYRTYDAKTEKLVEVSTELFLDKEDDLYKRPRYVGLDKQGKKIHLIPVYETRQVEERTSK